LKSAGAIELLNRASLEKTIVIVNERHSPQMGGVYRLANFESLERKEPRW